VSTYVEDALVIVDNDADARIVAEAGYRDDMDRDCLRFQVEIKGTSGEMRVPNAHVMLLAKRLIELAKGRKVKLTVRNARWE
jgi:hypothetical protein